MAIDRYKEMFPKAELVSKEERKRLSKVWMGAKNPKKKKRVKVKCEQCGREYEEIPSRIRKSNHHFCSKDCYLLWDKKKNHPNWTGGKLKVRCEYCRKPIERYRHHLEISEHHFCSHACQNKVLKDKKVELNCDNCGRPFNKPPSKVWEHNFCSDKCRIEYWKKSPLHVPEALKGKEHPNYGKVNYPKPYYVEELGHSVRSKWEEEIGLLLKANNITYGYETKTFKFNGTSYTPDFTVGDNIIEVKGPLYDLQRKKYREFNELHPELNFVMVGNGSEEICDIHIPWKDRERLVEALSR